MNNIKMRLIAMNFLQFFVWGSWLTSIGVYLGKTLDFSGSEIGGIFATMGIAAIIMPAVVGMIADRFVNAEKLLGICHIIGGLLMFVLTMVEGYNHFFWVMLLYTMMYMPTLALTNSIAYYTLKDKGLDIVKDFPPIRVWGTVGFILAMWFVDLNGWTSSINQLYLAGAVSIFFGLYAFTLPKCFPNKSSKEQSFASSIGLDALHLLKEKRMAIFFLFSMLLGAALQVTNMLGQPFLSDFAKVPEYADTFAVQHPGILTSVSQISEALFILAIPFFLRRFGIKTVMMMSMGAWFLRFGLFGVGDPGSGFIFLVLSMIVYGMAFDFFNVSGSLFVEQGTQPHIRSSAQGLFVLMTNGIGTILGTLGSGYIVDLFTSADGMKDWTSIWFLLAGYSITLLIVFALVFKDKKYKSASEEQIGLKAE